MTTENFYGLSVTEVEKSLETNVIGGLSSEEVRKRREMYGYNEFEKKKHKGLLGKFLSQFKSFMIIVLLAAAAISGAVGYFDGEGFMDAVIILLIVILNAVIGVFQESKAEKSLDALEKLSSPHCKVIRDGNIVKIESREIVPGDVILLETGDTVPADLRLTEAVNLKAQEASLTGESVPVDKNTAVIEGNVSIGDRVNMAYSSTSITYGRGKGIVTATGMKSEVGKIASMIQSVPDTKTPLQERLDKLGKILAIIALSICVIIFIVGIAYGRGVLEMFMTAVSLAAAAIPEGLPAVSTIVLAVGVQRLVKRNAIVRKLPSVETLGSTQVICSDKTGTLTQNRMTVVRMYANGETRDVSGIGKDNPEDFLELMRLSILANDAMLKQVRNKCETIGDPTETALLDLGLKFGVNKTDLEREYPRSAEIPFDSDRKMMSTVHECGGKCFIATKGAPDEVLERCEYIKENGVVRKLTPADIDAIKAANYAMASNALRVLATATSDRNGVPAKPTTETVEKGLVFVGLLGMIDPPREEVKDAVAKCRTAGIKPVMITGDHKITATVIAEALGIMLPGDMAVTGQELEAMSDDELRNNIERISVYARVSPEHKVRIVKAFQNIDRVVAMTGDGVNDAPALKLADIGVAMGITGTDVSKEAADVVLADDNFTTIVAAVEEGRRIYDNILKAIQFLLSSNVGEILVLLVAVIFNWAAPLLPIHILWVNLVTDSLPALALGFDPVDPDIMHRKPIDSKVGIMNRSFSLRILLQGVMIGGLSLSAYWIGLQASPEVAQTMTFSVLAFTQITFVFSVRSATKSAFKGMFNNKHLIGSLLIVTALMFLVLEIPFLKELFHIETLNRVQWIWVAVLSVAPIFITDMAKLIVRLFNRK